MAHPRRPAVVARVTARGGHSFQDPARVPVAPFTLVSQPAHTHDMPVRDPMKLAAPTLTRVAQRRYFKEPVTVIFVVV